MSNCTIFNVGDRVKIVKDNKTRYGAVVQINDDDGDWYPVKVKTDDCDYDCICNLSFTSNGCYCHNDDKQSLFKIEENNMFNVGDKVWDILTKKIGTVIRTDTPNTVYVIQVDFGDDEPETYTKDGMLYDTSELQRLYHLGQDVVIKSPSIPEPQFKVGQLVAYKYIGNRCLGILEEIYDSHYVISGEISVLKKMVSEPTQSELDDFVNKLKGL